MTTTASLRLLAVNILLIKNEFFGLQRFLTFSNCKPHFFSFSHSSPLIRHWFANHKLSPALTANNKLTFSISSLFTKRLQFMYINFDINLEITLYINRVYPIHDCLFIKTSKKRAELVKNRAGNYKFSKSL